ncbi:MAG: hypothetical protein AB1295_06545 [Candidatus Micrarchaeota archaeon]
MSKGQVWSVDFTAASLTFIFMLLLFAIAWRSLDMRWGHASMYRQMQTDALFAADSLLTTPGEPAGWERGDLGEAEAIGLAASRSVLDSGKLSRLSQENSSYYLVKERLGVQRYDLGIRITDLDREETLYEYGVFGTGLNDSVSLDRLAILDGESVIVRVEVSR